MRWRRSTCSSWSVKRVVPMLSRPPPGMASRALTARFRSTCSSWPGSALTAPAPGSSDVTSSTSSPSSRRSIRSMFATTALRQHLGSEHLPAAEREQLPRELRGPKPRVPDFLGILAARVAGGRVVQQQLGRAQDGREQVVEVVGDAARELHYGFHLLRLTQLLLEVALGAHIAGEHEPGAAAGELERPGDEIHVESLALLRPVTDPGAHGTVVRPLCQLLIEPGLLLRRANVAQRELQELGLRVPVPGDGGPIHRQDAQGLEVVYEHRLGIGLEQQAVFALALVQLLLGLLPLDRHGDMRGDELQDVLLRLAVADAWGVR